MKVNASVLLKRFVGTPYFNLHVSENWGYYEKVIFDNRCHKSPPKPITCYRLMINYLFRIFDLAAEILLLYMLWW